MSDYGDINALRARLQELNEELLNSDLDRSQREILQKESSHISGLVVKIDELNNLESRLLDAKKELSESVDEEMCELYQLEIEDCENSIVAVKKDLDDILYPPDEFDRCGAYIEIRAGAGGQEAALFAYDLVRMYTNYCLNHNFPVSIVDANETDLKGYKEVTLHVKKKGAYGIFKFESGVHRVQRVPKTEGSGRVHTSTVTVAVFPEVSDDVNFEIKPEDLRIDYYRASGAGGQHVNKTESAVRITHLPTGVVVACQDERSQHKNKAKAMKALKSRLVAEQKRKQEAEMAANRKSQVGRGMRAEKARTYNFPQNRVTDHNISVTFNNLDMIIEGQMEKLIDALQESDRQDRKQIATAQF